MRNKKLDYPNYTFIMYYLELTSYCIGFDRNIDSMGGGLTTRLTIAPDEITINGISFDNHWAN